MPAAYSPAPGHRRRDGRTGPARAGPKGVALILASTTVTATSRTHNREFQSACFAALLSAHVEQLFERIFRTATLPGYAGSQELAVTGRFVSWLTATLMLAISGCSNSLSGASGPTIERQVATVTLPADLRLRTEPVAHQAGDAKVVLLVEPFGDPSEAPSARVFCGARDNPSW